MKRTHLFLSAALALTLAAASDPMIRWWKRANRLAVTPITQTAPAPAPVLGGLGAIAAAPVPAGSVLGLQGRLSHAKALEGGVIYARFDVAAAQVERRTDEVRAPARIMLVLDRSGSMNGSKWTQAQAAALSWVERMNENDVLGVVAFDDGMLSSGPFTTNAEGKRTLKEFLQNLSPGGGTNISGGIESAVARLPASVEASTRVVLISDGQPTNGITDTGSILSRVGALHERGYTVTALGVGTDFNATLMQGIAERGAGFYAYLDDASRLNSVLEKELGQARQSIARQVRFELTVPTGATVTDIPGRQFVRNGNTVSLTLPDFAPGQTAQVFVALQVDRDASMAKISSRLGWRDVTRGTDTSSSAELVAAVTSSRSESDASRDEAVFADGLRAVGNKQLVLAAAAYESGDREQAFALMDNVRSLFGMSADALAGDTADLEVAQRNWKKNADASVSRAYSKSLTNKSMKSFGQNNAY